MNVATFKDLSELFEIIIAAAGNPKQFVIRGRLTEDAERDQYGHVRRTSRKQKNGEGPSFEGVDCSWVMIDFDKVDNPEGIDPASVEAMGYLRFLLPPEFRQAACIYSLSASAGLTDSDMISGHLWFVFDRPASNRELKTWLTGYPVDKALFNPVQPHFTASPIFKDGRVDPIDIRNGLLPGLRDVVTVPVIDVSKPVRQHTSGAQGLEAAIGYAAKITLLGDGAGKQGCHGVITPAIAAYMSRHGPQADREALKTDIRNHVAAAQWDRDVHPEEYIAHETSDDVLDRSIQDWIDKTFIQSDGYELSGVDGVDAARTKVRRAVERFATKATNWWEQRREHLVMLKEGKFGFMNEQFIFAQFPPPRHGVDAQVGLGKTEAYLSQLPRFVAALKKGHCVVIGVPNHRLSMELKQRAQNHGVDAEVYLGPKQKDPDQPGKSMCWTPDKLQIMQKAGIGGALCKACPHRQHCGFQKQRVKKSLVWIVAHQIIFRARAKPIPPVEFVIIDEDPLGAGLEGENPKQPKLLLCDDVPDDVVEAISKLPLGCGFPRDEFDISDDRLRKCIRDALSAMKRIKLTASSSQQDINDAIVMAKWNSRQVEQAQFYRAILKSGLWGMRACRTTDGRLALRWVRQRVIHREFDVPTLFADATAQWDATRHVVDCDQSPPGYVGETWIDEDGSISIDYDYPLDPVISPITVARAGTPHVSIRQIKFSSAASRFSDNETGQHNVERVRRYIEARSAKYGRTLVICQLRLEEQLTMLGLPPNVETVHFNALRGRDEWKDIDLLIVIGRTQPPPNAMELQAEALFHTECKTLGPDYYDYVWAPLTGTDELVRSERHPDPLAEIMRWSACEAEVIQAIGRGRGLNRTKDDPLQVDIINIVPLPDIEVDEVIERDDAQPGARDVIAGRYGLILPAKPLRGAADIVAALLPDLFASVNAAKQAKVYSRAETPNKDYLLGVSAREYTSAPPPLATQPVAVKAPGCRYAVLSHALRPPTRRPLNPNETPPKGADINDDGVLVYGPVYVLKDIPRRLKPATTK